LTYSSPSEAESRTRRPIRYSDSMITRTLKRSRIEL
jgi:hypothetical protein